MTAGTEIKGMNELMAWMNSYPDRVLKAAKRELLRGILTIQRNAKKAAPVHTGRLKASIHAFETSDNGYAAKTNLNYSRDVEFGRGPHDAGYANIKRWVQLKFKQSGPVGKWKPNPYFVTKAIMKKGTKAQPFLFPARDEELPKAMARVKKAIKEATK